MKAQVGQNRDGKPVPLRMCIVCRARSDKRTLTRLVNTGQGVYIDPTGKRNGRGAYLCGNRSCWERAVSTDMLGNALRIVLTAEDRARLAQSMPQR